MFFSLVNPPFELEPPILASQKPIQARFTLDSPTDHQAFLVPQLEAHAEAALTVSRA